MVARRRTHPLEDHLFDITAAFVFDGRMDSEGPSAKDLAHVHGPGGSHRQDDLNTKVLATRDGKVSGCLIPCCLWQFVHMGTGSLSRRTALRLLSISNVKINAVIF